MKSHQFTSNMGGSPAARLRLLINSVPHEYMPFGPDVDIPINTGSALMAQLPINITSDVITNNSKDVIVSGAQAWAEGNGTIARDTAAHAEGNSSVGAALATLTSPAVNDTTLQLTSANAFAESQYIRIDGVLNQVTAVDNDNDTIDVDIPVTCDVGTTIQSVSIAYGNGAHVEGRATQALDQGAHAEGALTMATDAFAHAEGRGSTADAYAAHAEGMSCHVSGAYGHAEGENCYATDYAAHAEGMYSAAQATAAHAEGYSSLASGLFAHAEGYLTITSGDEAHAEGYDTRATNTAAHAEGRQTQATNYSAHAEGDRCVASGINAHAEGERSTASEFCAHAEGTSTASGYYAHAEGQSYAKSHAAHAEGEYSVAAGDEAHAEGYSTTAVSYATHAEGSHTIAFGICAHAEGHGAINDTGCVVDEAGGNDRYTVKVTNIQTFNVGDIICFNYDYSNPDNAVFYSIVSIDTVASTIDIDNSTAAELGTAIYRATAAASSDGAHSEGCNCLATGYGSHAGGANSRATGYAAHALGCGTYVSQSGGCAIGNYNADNEALFSVGNGTDAATRSDAFKVDQLGKVWFTDSNGVLTDLAALLAAHNIT